MTVRHTNTTIYMQKSKSFFCLSVGVSFFLLLHSVSFALEGEELATFNQGKTLIYENVGEGIRSLENLKSGITLLEKLLNEPRVDSKVHLVLADGYRTMAVIVYGENSQERAEFFEKEKSVLERAVALEPDSVRLLERYALTLQGEERARINRRILTIEENNANAYLSLGHEELAQGNDAIGVDYIRKAYELSKGTPDQERIRLHLEEALIKHASNQELVEFRLREIKESNASKNREQAKLLKLSLELNNEDEIAEGDLAFAVVFTNTSQQSLVIPKYTEIDLNRFWFSIFPEAGQKSLRLRSPETSDSDDQDLESVNLEPGESVQIESKLSDLLPSRTTQFLDDGGYIMYLQYLSPTRGHLYSDPVHFRIRDFVNNDNSLSENEFTLTIETESQGNEVPSDATFTLVLSNNSKNAIEIIDHESVVADFYTIYFKEVGARFEILDLPRLDKRTFDFKNAPTLTIEPGEQYRINLKLVEFLPGKNRLEDGKYGLFVEYKSHQGKETVFYGKVRSNYFEFSVENSG